MRLIEKLKQWFEEAPAPWTIGQLVIRPLDGQDAYEIFHQQDMGREDAIISSDPYEARQWVKIACSGEYRPLKGEDNLSPGWKLSPLSAAGVMDALNIFYPTAIANWLCFREKKLRVTSPRETFERQSGMYRVVKNATDAQIDEVAGVLCHKRCLKIKLWKGEHPVSSTSQIPLLCPEVCNLYVAGVRSAIKGETLSVPEE